MSEVASVSCVIGAGGTGVPAGVTGTGAGEVTEAGTGVYAAKTGVGTGAASIVEVGEITVAVTWVDGGECFGTSKELTLSASFVMIFSSLFMAFTASSVEGSAIW